MASVFIDKYSHSEMDPTGEVIIMTENTFDH